MILFLWSLLCKNPVFSLVNANFYFIFNKSAPICLYSLYFTKIHPLPPRLSGQAPELPSLFSVGIALCFPLCASHKKQTTNSQKINTYFISTSCKLLLYLLYLSVKIRSNFIKKPTQPTISQQSFMCLEVGNRPKDRILYQEAVLLIDFLLFMCKTVLFALI